MSKRIRVVVEGLQQGLVALPAETQHYLTRVHRLAAGEQVLAADPEQGIEATAELVRVGNGVGLEAQEPRAGSRPGWPGLELVWALGKGDKLERVLRDVVSFGAGRLVLVESARSVPRSDARTSVERRNKQQRWRSILLDAVRQTERSTLPQLSGPWGVSTVLEETTSGTTQKVTRIVLHPGDGSVPLLAWCERLPSGVGLTSERKLQLWVGPEGGFSPTEIDALRSSGAHVASLGELVLRTEVAAGAVLAIAAAWLSARSERSVASERRSESTEVQSTDRRHQDG